VTSAGSSDGEWATLGPYRTSIATFRRTFRGRPLVRIRCVPHTAHGTSGAPAASAIRAAPVFPGRGTNERLMVPSGNMPTTWPRRSRSTESRTASRAWPYRSTGMCFIARISGPATG
jgi:hypothetical protein